jgi:hypothetical protein
MDRELIYTYNLSGHTINMASSFLFSMSIMACRFRQITLCRKMPDAVKILHKNLQYINT